MLLEKVDSINTEVAAFDEYLKIVSEVLAQYGNQLFVGRRLATTRWDDLRVEINRVSDVCPTTGQAARMFSMNLGNWRHDRYVQAAYSADKLERLAIEIDELTDSSETGRIVWQMRQISARRNPA